MDKEVLFVEGNPKLAECLRNPLNQRVDHKIYLSTSKFCRVLMTSISS